MFTVPPSGRVVWTVLLLLLLCLWAHDVWGTISRNPLEIETWVQWTTNRKWLIGIQMVTWPMTSRDPERSRSWPQYIWDPLSRQWLEIWTWCQWSTYRKWLPGYQMVMRQMTSPGPERSRSCLNIFKNKISGKRMEIETWVQWTTNRKWPIGIRMVTCCLLYTSDAADE